MRQLFAQFRDYRVSIWIRAWVVVKLKEQLTLFDTLLIIHMQHKNRSAAFGGERLDERSIEPKMFIPAMTTGMKQEGGFIRQRVSSGDVRSFVKVAPWAT